jgi:hypothetical protein
LKHESFTNEIVAAMNASADLIADLDVFSERYAGYQSTEKPH